MPRPSDRPATPRPLAASRRASRAAGLGYRPLRACRRPRRLRALCALLLRRTETAVVESISRTLHIEERAGGPVGSGRARGTDSPVLLRPDGVLRDQPD